MSNSFGNLLLDMCPPAILAAGVIRSCRKLAVENPEYAQRVLQNSWIDISPHFGVGSGKPTGKLAASLLLIESYFRHRGDWKAMEQSMIEAAPDVPLPPEIINGAIENISRMFDRTVAQVQKEGR